MLILFDIDGTLLRSQGAGVSAMEAAGRQLYGPGFSFGRVEVAGRIDPLIWADLARAHDVDDHETRHAEFRSTYVAILTERLRDSSAVEALDGATALVDRLEGIESATLGLLTGNYPESGRAKIESAGIDPSRFPVTAWGSDGRHRRDLPAVAMERYRERTGEPIRGDQVVVIGDTPHDVDCARANDCLVIAVATGQYTRDDLDACRPDLLVDDLTDGAGIVQWMLDATGTRES